MKTGINLIFIFFFGLFLISCDKNKGEKQSEGLYENSENTDKAPETPKVQGTTSMEFENIDFDFGTIKEGQIVSHSFKFKNTGTVPLVISDARADCGCTVPNPPKEPIMPGKESQIDVKFNSSGKGGDITKTITVLANTEPSDSKLHITGKVIRKDEGTPLKK